MRSTRLLLAVAALLPLAATAQSRIDAVTVYPGQLARIERVAELRVDAGSGEQVFAGLPAAIQPDSVRVETTGDLRLGSVEIAREPVGEPPREREAELRQRIDDLKQQRQAARDRVAAAKNRITFIEGLAKLPQGEGAAEALTAGDGAERWSALLERIGEGTRTAYRAQRANEREAHDLQQQIDTLQRQLNQLGGDRRERVNVTVPYRAESAGAATLRLTYRVRGPRWQPRYETRLDTSAGALALVRSARVQQATGEDWTDVRLALSTAQPVHGDRPEPQPWWIDLAPKEQPEAAADMAGQSLASEQSSRAPAADRRARTVNAEFAATYAIPGRVTVPAGNQPRELRLGEDTLQAELGARVFAQRDTRAWLTATVEWNGEGPLPGGRVARFRDGAYVGTGGLGQWSPGEEREQSFGLDPRIDVHFEPVRDEAGESGWITTRSTLARRYALKVTNRHGRALPVTALFRVPVPRNEAIDVETAFSRAPDQRDIDERKGVHAWRLDLGAGETATLELGYTVEYPEGRQLRGL